MNPPQLSHKPKILNPFHAAVHHKPIHCHAPVTLAKEPAGPRFKELSLLLPTYATHLEELFKLSDPSLHHLLDE